MGSAKSATTMVQTLARGYLLQIEIFASSASELEKLAGTLQTMVISGSDD